MKGKISQLATVAAILFLSVFLLTDSLCAAVPDYQRLESIEVQKPTAVAVDAEENIYVAEAARNQVTIFDSNGSLLGIIAGLAKPISIAVDSDGRIYIGNDNRNNVEVYSPERRLLTKLGRGDGEFIKPNSIAINSQGYIYVVDSKADLVKVFTLDNSSTFSFGGTGGSAGLFTFPTAIAINEATDEVIVTDYQLTNAGVKMGMPGMSFTFVNRSEGKGARAQIFSLDGRYKRSFSQFGSATGQLNKPLGVATDKDGNIYVADAYQNAVQVFDSSGASLGVIYSQAYPMRTPTDIAISPLTDRIYIPSLKNSRVDIYSLATTYTVTATAGPGGAISPTGPLEVDHGEILSFVITPDAGFNTSQVLVDGIQQDTLAGPTLTVTADRTVTAVFEPNTFTVTATAGANGSVSPAGANEVIAGDSLTIVLNPAPNYHLDSLTVDNADVADITGLAEYTFADVQAPHRLSAGFAIDTFTIGTVSNANGEVSIPDGGVVAYGGSLTVTILPRAGYRLTGLLVDGNPVAAAFSYTFTDIISDHTVVPVFDEILYTITAASAEGGSIAPAGATIVKEGASLNYTIIPAQGFILTDVLVDGAAIGPIAAYKFNDIHADHSITPVFAEDRTFERFESGDLSKLPWITGGGSGWQVQSEVTFAGSYSTQTPDTPASFLEVPLDVTEAGDIGFWFSLSGDNNLLRFLIDGVEQAVWSGDWAWTDVLFAVTPGQHTFRWEYTGGRDYNAAWLDDINLPPYADPLYPMLDLKVNNSDGPLTIGKRDELTLSVMALYGDWQPPAGSQWVITRINTKSVDDDDDSSDDKGRKDDDSDDSDSDDEGIAGKKLVRFTWQVPDSPTHVRVLKIDKMPRGEFTMVFGLYTEDSDMPLYYDTVDVLVKK